ncbi:MAG: acyl-CoA dehydrogenase [Acidimicrobiales bacterium]
MAIAISDEHVALEQSARRFLAARCPSDVVRAGYEDDKETLPPFWDELVELGWLGLHIAEADGGQGYGYAELAVVLEQLGAAMAPGPFLPTVLAAAAIGSGPLLAPIVGGAPASIAFSSAALTGGPSHVTGTTGPVWCPTLAQQLIVPVATDDGELWCVLSADQFEAHLVASLDGTRRLGTVTVRDAHVASERRLAGLTRDKVRTLVAALVAAECAGIGGWCVETAADYAKVRSQFGRPIGQFQAVKHRCSDMLVAVEQARSLAWDAAAAMDDSGVTLDEVRLAADVAGALSPDAAVEVAKDCIQVLGGMGFTWEHDAHLYLRRATSVRQLVGGTSSWRESVARAALAGTRRQLHVKLPADAVAFRDQVRVFVAAVAGLSRDEQRERVVDGGWFVPHWPAPWGREASAVEQLVIDEEFRAGRIRRPNLAVGAWAAPTIVAHGTLAQQERWVRPTLLGTIAWCQLFSEPGAGSDLAALSTAARRVEGGWSINGQKVWTSMAREADWGICLARTNPTAPKHLGITYFIVDMRTPGIDVRPLRELTGMAMFNEVFLTDVFVPDDCVIGEVDEGWPLARTTLANERVAMASGSSFGGGIEALLSLVGSGDAPDAVGLDRLGELLAEAQSVALLGLRSTHRSLAGPKPGPEASVRKLLGVEHDQRTQEFGLSLLGPDGATAEGAAAQWTFGFLANRCLTIAGGTSEIQRNVIAERILGLPRD